jgi:hypothetical protein
VRFGEADELDAVECEPSNVIEGLPYSFTRETVERPDYYDIKLTSGCTIHHLPKLRTVGFPAGFVVLVFGDNRPPLGRAEFSKLPELVVSFLALVAG